MVLRIRAKMSGSLPTAEEFNRATMEAVLAAQNQIVEDAKTTVRARPGSAAIARSIVPLPIEVDGQIITAVVEAGGSMAPGAIAMEFGSGTTETDPMVEKPPRLVKPPKRTGGMGRIQAARPLPHLGRMLTQGTRARPFLKPALDRAANIATRLLGDAFGRMR